VSNIVTNRIDSGDVADSGGNGSQEPGFQIRSGVLELLMSP